MRILVTIVRIGVVIALLIGIGILCRNTVSSKPQASPPEVVAASLWVASGIAGWECIQVSLCDSQIRAIGMDICPSARGCHSIGSRLSDPEVRALSEQILDAQLEFFVPRSEWFDPFRGCIEGSTYLVIGYRHGEVVFAVPAPAVGRHLPDHAAKRYDDILLISRKLMQLKQKHVGLASSSRPVTRWEADRIWKHFDDLYTRSLPRGRQGW